MSAVIASPARGTYLSQLFPEKMPHAVAFVGSGGKTTSIKTLAAELLQTGQRVIVTTTTKMHPPQDSSLLGTTPEAVEAVLRKNGIAWAGQYYNEYKMEGIPGAMPALCAMADCVLIEADGSRKLPLKMIHADYEPVVPPEADAVVALAGMDGVGRPVRDVVHRSALACEALGVTPEHLVTPADVAALLRLCYAPKVVVLNKTDTARRRAFAMEVAALLPEARCLITSLRDWGFVGRQEG